MTPFRRRTCAALTAGLGLFLIGVSGCAASASGEGGEESSDSQSRDGDEGGDFDDDGISLSDPDPILAPEESQGLGGSQGVAKEKCLTVASFGTVQQEGAVPGAAGLDGMVQWFNDETSASAKHFIEKPLLSAEFLAEFDLLLLQNLAGWSWGSGEIALIKSWVSGGGAVVALSGHGGSGHEVLPTNELISFSGLNFSGASGMGDTALNVSECGYCLGTSHQQGGWLPEHPISFEVTAVGAFQGRSIYGTGDLVAQENGKTLGMTAPYGAGRIFLFHDDWVSYPNLWNQASTLGCESNISCSDVSPVTTYQVAQFWYNTVRYLVSEAECFTINDPVVTVK